MPSIRQIRGMLLEEALLCLLRASGFRTIEEDHSDPTLHSGPSGLEVRGRGSRHQVDAIAEYLIAQPFSYPQRLLVEAKCYEPRKVVGLPIMRNAVGVVRDVEEYWTLGEYSPLRARYHYLYAIFSASGFTKPAEEYAFAQGVYPMPLAKSKFLEPLLRAIRDISHEDFGASSVNSIDVSMGELRRTVRSSLRHSTGGFEGLRIADGAQVKLIAFVRQCGDFNGALLGMIAKRFPVFLVPSPSIKLEELKPSYSVHIHWDQHGWYLRSSDDEARLFSFDLPVVLFEAYATGGLLSANRALDLKAEYISEIQATLVVGQVVQLVTFHLDEGWLAALRQRPSRRSS